MPHPEEQVVHDENLEDTEAEIIGSGLLIQFQDSQLTADRSKLRRQCTESISKQLNALNTEREETNFELDAEKIPSPQSDSSDNTVV